MTDDFNNTDTIELTADVISAYVSNNPVPVSELPSLIAQVHQSLAGTVDWFRDGTGRKA